MMPVETFWDAPVRPSEMIGLEASTVISSKMVSSASLNFRLRSSPSFRMMPGQFLGLERVHGDLDRVGAADFDGRDVVETILAADGGVNGAGWRVQGGDGGSDYGVAVTVRDQAVEG